MKSGEEVKRELEMSMAKEFVKFLNRNGQQLPIPRPGRIELREPDAVCDLAGGPVGIEVAAAYYSDAEARDAMALRRGRPELSRRYVASPDKLPEVIRNAPLLMNFTDGLIRNLKRTTKAHCDKGYCMPSYFVLDATARVAPITTADDRAELLSKVRLPADSTFIAGYIALTPNWTSGVAFYKLRRR
jgi:hypothetical protein